MIKKLTLSTIASLLLLSQASNSQTKVGTIGEITGTIGAATHYVSKGIESNTIARISLKSPPFNIQTQNDFSVYTEPRYYFGPVTISKFNISLRDEYKRIIDLNKNDISFTLRLTIIYSD
jgi:hypothetical protein